MCVLLLTYGAPWCSCSPSLLIYWGIRGTRSSASVTPAYVWNYLHQRYGYSGKTNHFQMSAQSSHSGYGCCRHPTHTLISLFHYLCLPILESWLLLLRECPLPGVPSWGPKFSIQKALLYRKAQNGPQLYKPNFINICFYMLRGALTQRRIHLVNGCEVEGVEHGVGGHVVHVIVPPVLVHHLAIMHHC